MSYTKATTLSKKKIAIKIKKINKLYHKWWDEHPHSHMVGMISWGLQKKFLSKHLIREHLLNDHQLKDFWKAFDAVCNISEPDWDITQLSILRTLVYLNNRKLI